VLIVYLLVAGGGCRSRGPHTFTATPEDCYHAIATQVEYPNVEVCSLSEDWAAVEPISLTSTEQPEYWDVKLEEVVQMALSQSKVIRDLGGAVLRSPATTQTYWDTAIVDTDPRFGVDAALSAFDAQFSTSAYGEKNDRALNNEFFGGGTRILKQDLFVQQSQITKQAVTGTQFSFRHYTDYDANNAPSNLFAHAWNTNFETEFRHPLLQGSGMEFNRIAGPSNVPGLYNGVLIARANTDIELADFEIGVRDLVSNLENAYWDLYFAYRDLDTKIAARDAALDTWRRIRALYESGRRGGEAEKEAQAREQFFRFQEDVQNALSGYLVDGTRTDNGSPGGTFRGTGGVYVAERRLRMLIGMPPTDGRLLRPSDEPLSAPLKFDWAETTREAVLRRAELRRQRFETRRYELEWIASKNFLLPQLDTIGRYRWRGFGNNLLDSDSKGVGEFDNAYNNLFHGDFQEWQVGMELTVPLGYRRGATAVRNAELHLARSRALLLEQEHLVLHNVANAVAETDRAFTVSQTAYNRLDAARNQLEAIRAAFDSDKAPLDLLLEAQRRLAEAESRYFRALAEYAVAVKNVHFTKGTLLDYDGVYLSEGGWPLAAYQDASIREQRRGQPHELNYASSQAPRVSHGPYDQRPGSVSHTILPLEADSTDKKLKESAPAMPLVPEADKQAENSLIPVWKPETISRLQTPSMPDPAIAPASFTDDTLHALPEIE
jgi:outer membrane protein TolC